jgi:hypothetical protein
MKFSHKVLWSSVMLHLMIPISANANNVYNSSTGLLTLPSVYFPSGDGDFQRYSAMLEQVPDPTKPSQMSFVLKDAKLLDASSFSPEIAYFTPSLAQGGLSFSLDVLGAGLYWIKMDAISDGLNVKFKLDLPSGVIPAQSRKILTVNKSGELAGKVKVSGEGIDCGSGSCWTEFTKPITLTANTDATKTSVKWIGCDATPTPVTCTVNPTSNGIRNVKVEIKDSIPSFCLDKDGLPLSSTFKSTPIPGSVVDFGNVQVNTSALGNLMISAPSSGGDLCVQSMGLTGSNASDFKIVDPVFPSFPEYLTFPAKSAKPIFIECLPSGKSLRTAILNLQTNDPAQPIIKYTLQCTGASEPQPNYWSDPFAGAEIDFGGSARNQETTPTTKLMINNRGLLPLEVYKLKISGKNASDFLFKGATSLSIRPNGPTQAFEMSCKPSDLGFREGVLELGSNDPSKTAITYPLKCEGVETCVIDYPPQDDINSEIISQPGRGFSAKYDRFKPESCLNGTLSDIGHTEFYLDGEIVDSLDEVANSFGIGGAFDLKLSAFKVKLAASYIREAKETERSTTFVYRFKVKFPNKQFNIKQSDPLSDMGKKVIRSPSCFENACGSHYISQVERGTDFYAFVRLDFASQQDKKNLQASLSASFKTLASLQLAMSQAVSKNQAKGSLSIKAIQRGGEATKLPNIFNAAKDPNDPTKDVIDATIKCALSQSDKTTPNDFTQCEKVMNNILIYAKNDFSKGASVNPQTLGYMYNRYDELSIGSPNVDFEPTPEVIQARTLLMNAYNRELDNYNKIQDLNHSLWDDSSKTLLTALLSKIDFNLDVIRQMAAWCYSDLKQCVDKQKQATAFEEDQNVKLSNGTLVSGMLKLYNFATLKTGIVVGVNGVSQKDNSYTFTLKYTTKDVPPKTIRTLDVTLNKQ